MASVNFLKAIGLDKELDNKQKGISGDGAGAESSIPPGGIPLLPAPDPALVAQHRACAANIDALDPEYVELKARVEKGGAYCRANIAGGQAKLWLAEVLGKDAFDIAAGQTARALLDRLKREQPAIREAVVKLLNLRRDLVKIEQRLEWETLCQSDIETSMLLQAGLSGVAYYCRGCGAFVRCEDYAEHEGRCCPRGGVE